MATIQNTAGMSLAAIAQQLTPGATPHQELRSKGTDLYVKQGTALFTNVQSRTDHRNSALAIVLRAIEQDLGVTPAVAQRFMQRVISGGQPGQITAGDLSRLSKAVELAGQFDPSKANNSAFRGRIAESLVHRGLTEAEAVDIVRALGGTTTRDLFQALETNDMAALGRLVNALPNTPETVDALLQIESALVAKADTGATTPPVLTVASHEVFHTKRTEAMEHILHAKLDGNTTPQLAVLSQLPKGEYWRLLMDGMHQGRGDKFFFDRSKGYMASMLAGLDMVVDKAGARLTVEMIKDLHKVSTTSVTYELPVGTSALRSSDFQIAGSVKVRPNVWGVCKNFSERGMQELQALRTDLQAQVPSRKYFVDENLVADKSRDDQVQSWSAGLNFDAGLTTEVEDLMQYSIDRGEREISAARTPDEKLGAIVDTCRRLGCIHPFKDANGRLMMFLVLNKLLMDNGFPPTILQDQGHMIGLSRSELVALIKAGQNRVELLVP